MTDALVFSIHIPKTAGNTFVRVLRQQNRERVALYYGPTDRRTHPAVACPQGELTQGHLSRLKEAGIDILHGHIRPASLLRLEPDQSRYWVWLREPIDRALSHYHYAESRSPTSNTLEDFLREAGADLQNVYCRGLHLEEVGFVGITELFDALVPMLGFRTRPNRRANVNSARPAALLAERQAAAPYLLDDLGLYSHAMSIALRRLQRYHNAEFGKRRARRGEREANVKAAAPT